MTYQYTVSLTNRMPEMDLRVKRKKKRKKKVHALKKPSHIFDTKAKKNRNTRKQLMLILDQCTLIGINIDVYFLYV